MSKKIFRKSSMERLSSPEQIDNMLTIISPKSWFILIGVFILLAVAVFWGMYGKISIKVNGSGILIRKQGIFDIVSTTNGQIYEFAPKVGEYFEEGDIIGRIEQRDLVNKINSLQNQLKELKSNEKSKRDEILENNGELESNEETEDLNQKIKSLQEELINKSSIVCPHYSRIVEVKAKKGDYVKAGQPVASVEKFGDTQEVVLYIPVKDGKKIVPGMKVEIYPSNVNKEVYGFLEGHIVYVSEYPATKEGMMNVLGNDELVNRFSDDTPIEVRVQLLYDTNTKSKYKWSSPKAKDIQVNVGTICKGSIIVKKIHPVDLLFSLNS